MTMFDQEAIRTRVFADMVRLCRLPAWKEWAWQEVKRMDEDGLFKGIKAHVLGEMNATRSKG
jgi:hypothetical protein